MGKFEYKFIGPLQPSGRVSGPGACIQLNERIKIKKNFNLSFEWKMKSLDNWGAVFLTSPSLLKFQFQKNLEKWNLKNGTGYFLDMADYEKTEKLNRYMWGNKDYDRTNWEPFSIHFGKWNKEF